MALMDINTMQKVIADEAGVAYNKDNFFVSFRSGDTSQAYVLDPAGAKAFSENLAARIKEYEAQVSPIDASGRSPQIVSPIQPR
jgi:hypothetical protein